MVRTMREILDELKIADDKRKAEIIAEEREQIDVFMEAIAHFSEVLMKIAESITKGLQAVIKSAFTDEQWEEIMREERITQGAEEDEQWRRTMLIQGMLMEIQGEKERVRALQIEGEMDWFRNREQPRGTPLPEEFWELRKELALLMQGGKIGKDVKEANDENSAGDTE